MKFTKLIDSRVEEYEIINSSTCDNEIIIALVLTFNNEDDAYDYNEDYYLILQNYNYTWSNSGLLLIIELEDV